MDFCDLSCPHASWPEDKALDGSESCRTFQALYCNKKRQLVYKNSPCSEKGKGPDGASRKRPSRPKARS